jgi:hypothetical protein
MIESASSGRPVAIDLGLTLAQAPLADTGPAVSEHLAARELA